MVQIAPVSNQDGSDLVNHSQEHERELANQLMLSEDLILTFHRVSEQHLIIISSKDEENFRPLKGKQNKTLIRGEYVNELPALLTLVLTCDSTHRTAVDTLP